MSSVVEIMKRAAQISILCRVSGNVNADMTIGQRILLKKMQNAEGEVKPFVSARAIKHCIREELRKRGYEIDPFQVAVVNRKPRSFDSGDPAKFVDNDLFGFMVAKEKEELASRRQAPVAISYLKSLRNVPVNAELGLRAPRKPEDPPLPFEVEVAEFIGRVDCIIYDYIGVYEGTEKIGNKQATRGERFIDENERRRRLHDFLEIFLTPSYVLPRRSNSLNVPEYLAGLVALSESGPKPVHQYLSYRLDGGALTLDDGLLAMLQERFEKWRGVRIFFIKYPEIPLDSKHLENFKKNNKSEEKLIIKPEEAVEEITNFILGG